MSFQRPELQPHPGPWLRFIRFAFWVLYNPLAWTYDWVSRLVSLGRWHDWQRAALPQVRGPRVLELAFGTGEVLPELYVSGYQATGLDLSPHMARIARQKLRARGMPVPLVRGRAQQLPFADGAFDTVLSTFPSDFMIAPETLSQIARVLRPGGRAVIVPMARLIPDSLWKRFLEWLYRITAQRGPLPDLRPELAALGLNYEARWVACDGTAVLILLLDKNS